MVRIGLLDLHCRSKPPFQTDIPGKMEEEEDQHPRLPDYQHHKQQDLYGIDRHIGIGHGHGLLQNLVYGTVYKEDPRINGGRVFIDDPLLQGIRIKWQQAVSRLEGKRA